MDPRQVLGAERVSPGSWRRLGSYLAGISARLVTGTEHSGINLSGVGLLALVGAQHSDIQALELPGEVLCQTEVHGERQRKTGRGGVLRGRGRERAGEKGDVGGHREGPGRSPWGLLVVPQPDTRQLVPAGGH